MTRLSCSQNISSKGPSRPRSLGDRLRCIRREKGLTQSQLASLANTNQSVIQKIENNRSLRPRKINEIAAALEVSPSWLMFGDESHEAQDAEAITLAELWSHLPEPYRSQIRNEILRHASRTLNRQQ